MNATDMDTQAAAARPHADPRADAGMVFLVGMLVAGALAVAATLTLASPSGAETAPASTHTSVAGR